MAHCRIGFTRTGIYRTTFSNAHRSRTCFRARTLDAVLRRATLQIKNHSIRKKIDAGKRWLHNIFTNNIHRR